jgi:hypothetical protein
MKNNKNSNSHKSSFRGGHFRRDIFVRRTESISTPPPKNRQINSLGDSGNGDASRPPATTTKPSSVGDLFRHTGQLLLHPRRQIKQSIFCRKMSSQRNISLPFLQTLV